jgi:hypothetical protein
MSGYAAPIADPQAPSDVTHGDHPSTALDGVVGLLERHWRLALAALLLLDGALLLYMGRGLTFFYDEWDFVTHDFGGGIHSVLVAHVGNISVVPVLVYKALFHAVGLNHYPVYRAAAIALHLLCGGLVFALASKRIGHAPALLAAALILFLGAAWEDLLWPFQIGYLLSIAGGLGALLLIERGNRVGDAGALGCLVIATGSSSLGIPILVGVSIELACRGDWKRGWVVGVPIALYVLWYLGYGESQVTEGGLINAPPFAMDLMASAAGALVGRGLDWGRPLAVAGVIALAWCLSRPRSVSPRLAGLLGMGLSLWVVTAVTRSTISAPETSRYVYLGAVVIVLVGVEMLRDRTFTARALLVAAVLVAVAGASGFTVMHNGASGLRGDSHAVAAELGALQIAAAYAPAGYQPDPQRSPQIQAGPYLHTVRAIGSSPADSPSEIASLDAGTRALADNVLLALERPSVEQLPAGLRPPSTGVAPMMVVVGAERRERGDCVEISPRTPAPLTAQVNVGARGVFVADRGSMPATAAFKRFGDEFHPIQPAVAAHSTARLSVRADGRVVPWQAQVASLSPLSICAANG